MDWEKLGFILTNSFPILMDAWEINGESLNLDVCIEECAELIKAITKYKRYKKTNSKLFDRMVNKSNLGNIKEEIADVMICLIQLIDVFEFDDIEEEITGKVNRLTERIY